VSRQLLHCRTDKYNWARTTGGRRQAADLLDATVDALVRRRYVKSDQQRIRPLMV
jgi:hypothetical protein